MSEAWKSKKAGMPTPLPTSQIPSSFHGRTPRRGPWVAGDVVPDRSGSGYQVLLSDGTTEAATWLSPEFSATGTGYWWARRELAPVGWRMMEDLMMRS